MATQIFSTTYGMHRFSVEIHTDPIGQYACMGMAWTDTPRDSRHTFHAGLLPRPVYIEAMGAVWDAVRTMHT